MLIILLILIVRCVVSLATCTCSGGYIPSGVTGALGWQNGDARVTEISGSATLGKSMSIDPGATAICQSASWHVYTSTTFPDLSGQISNVDTWNFRLDFKASAPWSKQDPEQKPWTTCGSYTMLQCERSDYELVVVTHEDSKRYIYALSYQFYHDTGTYYSLIRNSYKQGIRNRQKLNFCRKILRQQSTSDLPWNQPTGQTYTFPPSDAQKGSWQLNSLLERKFDCPSRNVLCYEAEFANAEYQYFIAWLDIGLAAIGEDLPNSYDADSTFSFDINNQAGTVTDFFFYASPTAPLPINFTKAPKTNGCYDLEFEVKARDTVDNVWMTTRFNLEYCNLCDTTSMTMLNPTNLGSAASEVTFVDGPFPSTQFQWEKFTWSEYPLCPIYFNRIVQEYSDGGKYEFNIEVSDGTISEVTTSQGSKTYDRANKWRGCAFSSTHTKGICTQFQYWNETPKSQYFGLQRVTISGAYYRHNDDTYQFDHSCDLTYELTIKNNCLEADQVVSFLDETTLIEMQSEYLTSVQPVLIDVSLFTSVDLLIDMNQIEHKYEVVCGSLTLDVSATEITPTVGVDPSHWDFYNADKKITLSYGVYWLLPFIYKTRTFDLVVTVSHSEFSKSSGGAWRDVTLRINEIDCSGRFLGQAAYVPALPPVDYVASTSNSAILLNKLNADLSLLVPINESQTPADCRDQAMFQIKFQIEGTWTSLPYDVKEPKIRPSPPSTFNGFHLSALVSLTTAPPNIGVFNGKVDRAQYSGLDTDKNFDLILCWMTQPDQTGRNMIRNAQYSDGSSSTGRLSIDVVGTKTSLAVEIQPYALNDQAYCGDPLYEFTTVPAVAFSSTASTITFNDFASIDFVGVLTVTAKVSGDRWPGLNIYTTEFEIDVIDCLAEDFTVTDTIAEEYINVGRFFIAPGDRKPRRFYTPSDDNSFDATIYFQEELTFVTEVAKNACSVWKYRITCETNQSDLTQLSTPATAQKSVYQDGSALSTDSEPCNRFTYGTALGTNSRYLQTNQARYTAGSEAAYEGLYKITGQFIHESGQPFLSSLSYEISVKLNCDTVHIGVPAGSLRFSIEPPASVDASLMPKPWPIDSDALFYWMRTTKEYEMHGEFSNPHPFSCNLIHKLGEIEQDSSGDPVLLNGIQKWDDTTRSNADLLISLNTLSSIPKIKVDSTYNHHFTETCGAQTCGKSILMMYEAKLEFNDTLPKASTSRYAVTFKYFIFQDCQAYADPAAALVEDQETRDEQFQIDGSSTTELVVTGLKVPIFHQSFSRNDGCPLTPSLVSTGLAQTDQSTGATLSNFWMDKTSYPSALTLHYKAQTNTEVQAYSVDTVICDLSDQGQKSCNINYWIHANSVNGTVHSQTVGTLEVFSECLYIKTRHATQEDFWMPTASEDKITDGYEVRDPMVTFELPYVQPELTSEQANKLQIFTRCGPMTYKVTIKSNKFAENSSKELYEPAIKITYDLPTVFASVTVSVQTDDQSFALTDHETSGNYSTQYDFALSAQFDLYPDFTFTYGPISFQIYDHCAGLILSEPPALMALTDYQNITQKVKDKDGKPQRWVNKISKHIATDQTVFEMARMSYTKWRPGSAPFATPAVTTGCGDLTYTLIFLSWSKAWEGQNIMLRPNGESYWTETGTIHLVVAEERFQIGDHHAILEVKSDIVQDSSKAHIKFELEILDCYVIAFGPGLQAFKDLQVRIFEQATLTFNEYVQQPACGFEIAYTVTLVEKPFGSQAPQVFKLDEEGNQPEPALITLLDKVISISPKQPHAGIGYAVFINGNVSVNSTMQDPVSAHNDQFAVQVPRYKIDLENTAPLLSNYVDLKRASINEKVDFTVGMPYDMQLDQFWVAEWGILSQDDIPSWISFQNLTIEDGIVFEIEPTESDLGVENDFFFVLDDGEDSQRYTFTVQVIAGSNVDLEGSSPDNSQQENAQPSIVEVFIDEPDSAGRINVRFSNYIKLPSDAMEWSSENEGSKRIHINFEATDATETLIYDQDLSFQMYWRVTDLNIKSEKKRSLQQQQEHRTTLSQTETLIEVSRVTFELNFSEPEVVSRKSFDSIQIEVQQAMFDEELSAYLADSANSSRSKDFVRQQLNFVEENKKAFSKKIQLPQQFDSAIIATAKAISADTSNTLMAFFSTNIFLSFFSAGALQYLWGLINSLQMIVLTALFNIEVAKNTEMVMLAILQMVSLDFIPTEDYIQLMFDFKETTAFETKFYSDTGEAKSKFGQAGYDNTNFIQLLGPIFFIILAFIVFNILRCVMKVVTRGCGENCCTKRLRRNSTVHVVVMRFILEGCVEVGLSAMIAVLSIQKDLFERSWDVFALALAFVFLLMLLVSPLGYIYLVSVQLKEKDRPDKEHELGNNQSEMFTGLRSNGPALRYPVIFTLRRYIIVLILTVLPQNLTSQINGHMIATVCVIAYLCSRQPYEKGSLNVQEILNECLVMLAAYPLLAFTDWVWDIDRRFEAGWAIIGCIVLIVVGNIIFLVVSVLCSWSNWLKLRYLRNKNINLHIERVGQRVKVHIEKMRRQQELEELNKQMQAQQNAKPSIVQMFNQPILNDLMDDQNNPPKICVKANVLLRNQLLPPPNTPQLALTNQSLETKDSQRSNSVAGSAKNDLQMNQPIFRPQRNQPITKQISTMTLGSTTSIEEEKRGSSNRSSQKQISSMNLGLGMSIVENRRRSSNRSSQRSAFSLNQPQKPQLKKSQFAAQVNNADQLLSISNISSKRSELSDSGSEENSVSGDSSHSEEIDHPVPQVPIKQNLDGSRLFHDSPAAMNIIQLEPMSSSPQSSSSQMMNSRRINSRQSIAQQQLGPAKHDIHQRQRVLQQVKCGQSMQMNKKKTTYTQQEPAVEQTQSQEVLQRMVAFENEIEDRQEILRHQAHTNQLYGGSGFSIE